MKNAFQIVFTMAIFLMGSLASAEVYQGTLTVRRSCSGNDKLTCQNLPLPQERRCYLSTQGRLNQPGVMAQARILALASTRDGGDVDTGILPHAMPAKGGLFFNAYEGDQRLLAVRADASGQPISFEWRLDYSVTTKSFSVSAFRGLNCSNLRRIQ